MTPQMRVVTVDGKKQILIAERTLITREQALEQIARLDARIKTELPATKAKLDANALLARAQEMIDRQIAQAAAVKTALESLVAQIEAK